jgi:hypothetical protein
VMRNCNLVMAGDDHNPGALVLMVSTGASQPKCFLTARANSATAIPRIKLIHSVLGKHVVALRQADDLHGWHAFAFVGEQVGDQLPSIFLEPNNTGAWSLFNFVNVQVPTKANVTAHCAQANAPIFLTSNAAGVATDVMTACMIPLMWASYFISGDTPKATLDKIERLVASVPVEDRVLCSCIQHFSDFGLPHMLWWIWPHARLF